MQDQFEQVAQYPTLTDSQRIQARKNAERNISEKYARKPRREDFDDYTVSRFPNWFSVLIASSLLFIALAAGVISAFRLYYAGYNQFYASIQNGDMARVVGVLTPLAAELLVIVAAIARQMYIYQNRHGARVALIAMGMGTALAFVGNWHIAQPNSTWGWIDTIFPPVAVLAVGFFFELTLIPELERRQSNENAYKAARDAYDSIVANPSKHPRWNDTYGWALWEMWAGVNRNKYDAQAIAREDRQMIAAREMDADAFFSGEIAGNFKKLQGKPVQSAGASRDEVLQWLRKNEGAISMSGLEIAEITGASTATVSRARKAYSQNGHSNGANARNEGDDHAD